MGYVDRVFCDDSDLGPLFNYSSATIDAAMHAASFPHALPAPEQSLPPAQPGAGREMSLEALESTNRSRDAQRIADYLRSVGPYGATRDEICVQMGIALQTVCGRCNDLLNEPRPLIYESELKRPTRSGRRAVVLVFGKKPS